MKRLFLALPRETREHKCISDLAQGLGKVRSTELQNNSVEPPKPLPPRFPVIIAEWERNTRELLRVSLDRFNGRNMIDIRSWWRDDDDTWKPSRGGLTLAVRHLPLLAEGVSAAMQRACSLGLVKDEQ